MDIYDRLSEDLLEDLALPLESFWNEHFSLLEVLEFQFLWRQETYRFLK